jgi:predicted acetyltransferase
LWDIWINTRLLKILDSIIVTKLIAEEGRIMKLIKLTPQDGQPYYQLLQNIGRFENGFENKVKDYDYEQYLQWLIEADTQADPSFGDEKMVPQVTYWMWDGHPVGIGRVSLRLNAQLLESGGNVAYAIAKNERRKDYGNALLALLLQECEKLQVSPVQASVNKDNEASNKVVVKNGGCLFKQTNIENIYRW